MSSFKYLLLFFGFTVFLRYFFLVQLESLIMLCSVSLSHFVVLLHSRVFKLQFDIWYVIRMLTEKKVDWIEAIARLTHYSHVMLYTVLHRYSNCNLFIYSKLAEWGNFRCKWLVAGDTETNLPYPTRSWQHASHLIVLSQSAQESKSLTFRHCCRETKRKPCNLIVDDKSELPLPARL